MALPDVSRQFLSDSRAFLTHDYLPKIERCVSQLTPEQVWFRANDASNSIGNLLLRLAELSAETLLEKRMSSDEEMTVLWCVYHIVEHFSMHTGQILNMAKALVGELGPST